MEVHKRSVSLNSGENVIDWTSLLIYRVQREDIIWDWDSILYASHSVPTGNGQPT